MSPSRIFCGAHPRFSCKWVSRFVFAAALTWGASVLAEESFTGGLAPADFESAGLSKLTPTERAKLDELVRRSQTGQVEQVKTEVRQQVKAEVKAEVRQEVKAEVQAEVKAEVRQEVKAEVTKEVRAEVGAENAKQASGPGFLDRLKVRLRPGTEIEYTTLETTILPPFHGWQNGTVFTLANGQRWTVSDDGRYWAPTVNHPVAAKIVPGSVGSFFMEIDHGGRPRVRYIGTIPSATPPGPAPQPPSVTPGS
jgi:hypothetical protein